MEENRYLKQIEYDSTENKKMENAYKTLLSNNRLLEKRIHSLESQTISSNNDTDALKQRNADLVRDTQSLKEQLLKSKDEMKTKEEELTSIKDELEKKKQELKTARDDLQVTNEKTESERKGYRESQLKWEDERATLVLDKQKLEDELNTLRSKEAAKSEPDVSSKRITGKSMSEKKNDDGFFSGHNEKPSRPQSSMVCCRNVVVNWYRNLYYSILVSIGIYSIESE